MKVAIWINPAFQWHETAHGFSGGFELLLVFKYCRESTEHKNRIDFPLSFGIWEMRFLSWEISSCVVSVLFCIFLLAFGVLALLFSCLCFGVFFPCLLWWQCNHRRALGCFLAVWWGLCCAFTEDGVPWRAHLPLCSVHDVHPGPGGAGRLRRPTHRAGGSALRPREVSGSCGTREMELTTVRFWSFRNMVCNWFLFFFPFSYKSTL